MKICLTEVEVKEIVLNYIQKNVSANLNKIELSNYRLDFCVITEERLEEKPEEKPEVAAE